MSYDDVIMSQDDDSCRVLVATDVAQEGIDAAVKTVIVYDPLLNVRSYIQSVGRIRRAAGQYYVITRKQDGESDESIDELESQRHLLTGALGNLCPGYGKSNGVPRQSVLLNKSKKLKLQDALMYHYVLSKLYTSLHNIMSTGIGGLGIPIDSILLPLQLVTREWLSIVGDNDDLLIPSKFISPITEVFAVVGTPVRPNKLDVIKCHAIMAKLQQNMRPQDINSLASDVVNKDNRDLCARLYDYCSHVHEDLGARGTGMDEPSGPNHNDMTTIIQHVYSYVYRAVHDTLVMLDVLY